MNQSIKDLLQGRQRSIANWITQREAVIANSRAAIATAESEIARWQEEADEIEQMLAEADTPVRTVTLTSASPIRIEEGE